MYQSLKPAVVMGASFLPTAVAVAMMSPEMTAVGMGSVPGMSTLALLPVVVS